jgi:NADH-quinone oxidoreductase subunit M
MLPDLGGLAKQIPWIGFAFCIMAFASAGLPGFANFASELLVLFGSWEAAAHNSWHYLYTVLAVWGIVISAVYLLRAVRWTFFGPLNPTWEGKVEDAKGFVWRAPFVMLIFVLALTGCYPKIILDLIDTGVQPIVETLDQVRQLAGK